MKLSVINEDSFLIQVSDEIDLLLTNKIASLVSELEKQLAEHLLDITPYYTTILVQYNLLTVSPLVVEKILHSIIDKPLKNELISISKQIQLPVYYHQSVGWDLQNLAQKTGLTIAQIIKIHSETQYKVCTIGFAPSFAFLAQLPEAIQVPRLTSPRAFVPAGSVLLIHKQRFIQLTAPEAGKLLVTALLNFLILITIRSVLLILVIVLNSSRLYLLNL